MNDDYLHFLVLSYNLGFYSIGDKKNNLIMNKAMKLSTKTERKSDQGSTKSDTENKSGKNILESDKSEKSDEINICNIQTNKFMKQQTSKHKPQKNKFKKRIKLMRCRILSNRLCTFFG